MFFLAFSKSTFKQKWFFKPARKSKKDLLQQGNLAINSADLRGKLISGCGEFRFAIKMRFGNRITLFYQIQKLLSPQNHFIVYKSRDCLYGFINIIFSHELKSIAGFDDGTFTFYIGEIDISGGINRR